MRPLGCRRGAGVSRRQTSLRREDCAGLPRFPTGEAREGEGCGRVNFHDLPDCARVLELGDGLALDANHHAVGGADGHHRGAKLHGLEGVVDLEKLPVGTEYSDGAIVRHLFLPRFSVLLRAR